MKIVSILALLISLQISQVFALGIEQSLNAALKLNVSGSSSVDEQFGNFVSQVCQPGTLDIFRNPADNSRAFSCAIAADEISGVAGGTTALFRKQSGGSIEGVGPVVNSDTVDGINLNTCTVVINALDKRVWECSNTPIQVSAEVGISDTEPEAYLIGSNGGVTATAADWEQMEVHSVNLQTFGMVVTPDLRDALQAAQGLTIGSDDVAHMPSLSSALVANIFAGRVAKWSALLTGSGEPIETNSEDVEVCNRTPGDGGRAQFNAITFGNPCVYRGAADFQFLGFNIAVDSNGIRNDVVRRTIGPALVPPPYFHEVVGAADMGKCLTRLAAEGRTGIGFQSLEAVAETLNDRNNYRFIALDRVTPTLENVAAGHYRNTAALSIQWRRDVVTAGPKRNAALKIVDLADSYRSIAEFNLALKTGAHGRAAIEDASDDTRFADVGTLAFAVASGNGNIMDAWDSSKPLSAFNKAAGLGSPSICAAPRLINNSQRVDVSY